MKFTDGCWMLLDGVVGQYPAEAGEVIVEDDNVVVLAPSKNIRHRGDTLGGPLFTFRFSAPMTDVVRVTAGHFLGKRQEPTQFAVNTRISKDPSVRIAGNTVQVISGKLKLTVEDIKKWQLDFSAEGKRLTSSRMRGLGMFDVPGGRRYIREQLALQVGETVYGLGERFGPFVKNGQTILSWNKDGGTSSDQAYKNIPFYMTNRGYGVFINHPEEVSFEVASEKVDSVQFSVPGERLDYYVIYGPTPKEILSKYTALTGRPALPPPWSFGLWLTTSFTTSYDEETITGFIQGMADRDLPLHVFHFDCFWMREFHWCDFEWDRRVFPDAVGMLSRLKARGLKTCVWINPYIAQASPLFAEGVDGGYFLKRPTGEVWQTDQWQPGMAIVDFTNPEATSWFNSKLQSLLDMGVDTFKTDFGERIPTDVVYHDGSDPVAMHNYYSYLYNKAVFTLLESERGVGDALVFARSGTTGSQSLPVHWGGDCESTFEAMAASLRGGLSLCLSGFGFWSHDIGGFEGTPPASLYKRWVAFGLLSSHSRLHGSSSYRVPWIYDDEAVNVLRSFTKLKCRLMPYLFGAAVEARNTGIPMMRAMALEFPDDLSCTTIDTQYMLGDSLLVAPIFSESGAVDYYVPEGKWTNYITGTEIVGPGWKHETHGYLSLPLLVRPNSVVPTGKYDDRPDYEFSDGVTFEVFAIDEGASATSTVPKLDGSPGLSVFISRSDNNITAHAASRYCQWSVLLAGITSAVSVEGGAISHTERGLLITAVYGSLDIQVQLS